VTLWFPSTAGDALVGDGAEIFSTADPGSRAKQIVVALLGGPQRAGALPALPRDTTLRQVYVLEDGTAWVDFSSQLRTGIGGGSADERLAVYAVVNSVALNVPEIGRVGILVEGNPVLTLNGHLDLRRALPADRSILSGAGVVGRSGEGD
jgi:spore germination protein GerM